jgi:hypothetical protein
MFIPSRCAQRDEPVRCQLRLDQWEDWEAEWEQSRTDVCAVNGEWGKEFTWSVRCRFE